MVIIGTDGNILIYIIYIGSPTVNSIANTGVRERKREREGKREREARITEDRMGKKWPTI